MTVFARSEVQSTAVATGCGQPHARPAGDDGQPVPVWALDCPACEPILASEPCWSSRQGEVPLTPDEQRTAEESARARLQGQNGLLGAMAGVLAQKYAAPASTPCGSCGDAMPAAARFCPSCGIPRRRHKGAADVAGSKSPRAALSCRLRADPRPGRSVWARWLLQVLARSVVLLPGLPRLLRRGDGVWLTSLRQALTRAQLDAHVEALRAVRGILAGEPVPVGGDAAWLFRCGQRPGEYRGRIVRGRSGGAGLRARPGAEARLGHGRGTASDRRGSAHPVPPENRIRPVTCRSSVLRRRACTR